jgi:hypothetical protein
MRGVRTMDRPEALTPALSRREREQEISPNLF